MRFKKKKSTYFIALEKGEKIIESLTGLLTKQNIKAGYFNAVGAVTWVEIGFLKQGQKQYISKVFEDELEIASLQGNVSKKEKLPYIHAHIILADKNLNTHGGHLTEAVVGATVEIVLVEVGTKIGRKFSKEVGLNLFEF